MIYTDQEHEWLSKPAKKKRVSNQRSGRQEVHSAHTTVMEYTERHII
jgi:hypothetical protein